MVTPVKIKIRPATRADTLAILSLEQQSFKTDLLSMQQIVYLIAKAKGVVLVVEAQRDIIGYAIILWRRGTRKTRLYSIAIAPRAKGKGYAQLLLKNLEKRARQHGSAKMSLEVHVKNFRAIRFYQHQGYCIIGHYEEYYQDGQAAWRMEKLI